VSATADPPVVAAFDFPRTESMPFTAGMSIDKMSVTVPTRTATDITMGLVAPVPRATLPAMDVSDIHRVDKESVIPEVTWPEYLVMPNPAPFTVKVESCMLALFTLMVELMR
jgi:hypothetical protein